jgi:hypothetical protein
MRRSSAERPGRPIVRASARTGQGVEAAFAEFGQRLAG